MRSTASTSPCSRPVPSSPRELAPRGRRPRRRRHRQLERLADGPRRPARREPGQPGRRGRATTGSSPTRTARRCSSCRCSWPCATASASSGWSSTPTSRCRAPAPRRMAELEAQIARARGRRAADRGGLSPPDRLQRAARDRRVPRERLHEGGMEGRHGEPQDPAPARPADLCTAVRIPVFVSHSEAVHVETREPIDPEQARRLFAAVPGVVVQDDPATHVYPLARRCRRPRRGLRRPGAPGSVDRRRARARVLGRQRQPAQGCGDERRRDRRAARRSAAGCRPGRRAAARRSPCRPGRHDRDATASDTDAGRAPRGDRGRGPGLHALPAPRDAHEGRAGRGQPGHRGRLRRRGPGLQRGPAGPAVRRPGRGAARQAPRARWAGGARMSSSRTSSSAGRPSNRDPEPDEIAACAPYLRRQLEVLDPALVVTLGRHLARALHARRPDLPGPRHGRSGRSRRPARATPWRSRSTTRRPRCGRRTSSGRATSDVARIPAALLDARSRRDARGLPERGTDPRARDTHASTGRAREPGPTPLNPQPIRPTWRRPDPAAPDDQLTLF